MKDLSRLVARFSRCRVLVLGDVMLDHFLVGDVSRINPEAPVPILNVAREYFAPGGAANAAANIASLGAEAVLLGYVGDDATGARLRRLLRRMKVTARFVRTGRPTIAKTRAIARGQQLLRLDYEAAGVVPRRLEASLLKRLRTWIPRVDAVLISDYGKGAVTRRILKFLTEEADPRPIVTVDPKPAHVDYYCNVTLVTPNAQEAGESVGKEIRTERDVKRAGRALADLLNSHVLLTRGEQGMSFFYRGGDEFDLPTVAKEVTDVTGAGDTVIAAVTLGLAVKAPIPAAVTLANVAAGLVVSKVGTATVTARELKRALR